MMAAQTWTLEHHRGRADEFHAQPLPEPVERAVWWFEVDRPTVVLGSSQPDSVVDARRADDAGVAVVRRRSGGGAVWLAPDQVSWVDVVLPARDPLWDDDVRRSGEWLGRAWVDAMGRLGVEGCEVHRGAMLARPWADLVCFAGVGPGEVTVAGTKVVGVSQRRTRAGARFQCAVVHRWEPSLLLDCLALDPEVRLQAARELAPVVHPVPADAPRVVAALLEALAHTAP